MANSDYMRRYRESYRLRTRQISLTLSLKEYKLWQTAAKKQGRRGVGAQIKAEALAYRKQEHLPELETQRYLRDLIRILRGIGTNLNQMAKISNTFRRVMSERQTIQLLKNLEITADDFIRQIKR